MDSVRVHPNIDIGFAPALLHTKIVAQAPPNVKGAFKGQGKELLGKDLLGWGVLNSLSAKCRQNNDPIGPTGFY
ncbi:hypothetical protein ES705_28060 [subsurface metagenome]